LIGSLRDVPFLFGNFCDSFKLCVQSLVQIGLHSAVVEFVVIVDTVDLLALIFILHQKKWVVIWLRSEGVKFFRLVDFEVFIKFFPDLLLLNTLLEYFHFLLLWAIVPRLGL